MFTVLLTKKKKMKKIFLFVSPLIFLVACSSGGGDTQPEILGCMDDCALNYNPDATSDAGEVCLYSFLGTYTISEYRVDGTSLFSNAWENPLVAGAIAFGLSNDGSIGVYGTSIIYADGTELVDNGTYVNSATQLIFYPSDGSASALWNTTKINCLEFDGNSMIEGMFLEIELDYHSGKLNNLEKASTNSKFDVTQFKRKK